MPAQQLFDPALIPAAIREQLGDDLEIRPLQADDHARGFFDTLAVLTAAPKLDERTFTDRFEQMSRCKDTYFIIVIVQKATQRIVACGTLLVERKFSHDGGIIGHVEDIAVSKALQGRKMGMKIINTLEAIGRQTKCYKIILDCSLDNIPFYEKCGFKRKEYQMALYCNEPRPSPESPKARL